MPRLRACWLLVLLLGGCVPEYRQPDLEQPHAVAKLRLAYHAWPGPMLEQTVMVDGSLVKVPLPVQGHAGAVTRTLRLRPGALWWSIRAAFFHNDVSTHAETHTPAENHPCDDIACTEPAPQVHNVNTVDRVNDVVCEAGMKQQVVAGATYVVQFDFSAERRCTLQCFRQVSRPGGKVASAPCKGS